MAEWKLSHNKLIRKRLMTPQHIDRLSAPEREKTALKPVGCVFFFTESFEQKIEIDLFTTSTL